MFQGSARQVFDDLKRAIKGRSDGFNYGGQFPTPNRAGTRMGIDLEQLFLCIKFRGSKNAPLGGASGTIPSAPFLALMV